MPVSTRRHTFASIRLEQFEQFIAACDAAVFTNRDAAFIDEFVTSRPMDCKTWLRVMRYYISSL